MEKECRLDYVVLAKQGDLLNPESLPATMVGINIIIDCATARPEEPTRKIDWEGKKALIQCAQVPTEIGPSASFRFSAVKMWLHSFLCVACIWRWGGLNSKGTQRFRYPTSCN